MSTTPRSEYYQAVYETGHQVDALVAYESLSAASFALCFGVFAGALVVAWRRSPERSLRDAHIPLEAPHKEVL